MNRGKLSGLFVTQEDYIQMQYEYAKTTFSSEAIAEARAEMLTHGGVSSAEMIESIRAAKREWEARR